MDGGGDGGEWDLYVCILFIYIFLIIIIIIIIYVYVKKSGVDWKHGTS